MNDDPTPPLGGETDEEGPAAPHPAEPCPWAGEPPTDDPDARRQRHDAFTEAKKAVFLKALVKTGCIQDACRLTGIARRTVYRHQEGDPRFFDHCAAALRMSGTPIELTAWQRAVEGVEEEFVAGGEVRVRRRYDGNLLRLLLQGSNPKKYGPRPGFKRKRMLRHERKQMEREIRAEIAETALPFDEAIAGLEAKLQVFGVRRGAERLANGWTKSPEGDWVPPGYGPIAGWVPPPPMPEGGEAPRDSV